MTDRVTYSAGLSSDVCSVTFTVLPSGNGVPGNPVTVLVPGGDVPWKIVVPFGALMVTVISSTLVFPRGTDTSVRMGFTPGPKGKLIVSSGLVKLIPGLPGARSAGNVESGSPVKVALGMF